MLWKLRNFPLDCEIKRNMQLNNSENEIDSPDIENPIVKF